MTQKILKVGSSAAVTIPKKILEIMGLSIGDKVEIEARPSEQSIVIEPKVKIRPEVMNWTEEFIKENRELLEELADR